MELIEGNWYILGKYDDKEGKVRIGQYYIDRRNYHYAVFKCIDNEEFPPDDQYNFPHATRDFDDPEIKLLTPLSAALYGIDLDKLR